MSWKDNLAVEYYDTIHIVFIPTEEVYGTVDQLGAFASIVKYKKEENECELLMDNNDFIIMDEITFVHVEEII